MELRTRIETTKGGDLSHNEVMALPEAERVAWFAEWGPIFKELDRRIKGHQGRPRSPAPSEQPAGQANPEGPRPL